MVRFVLSVVALAGVLSVAHPVSADPLAATVFDYVQAAAAAEQPSLSAPARAISSDVLAPTGFGWG
jgi:hypothetical protein